MQRRVWSLVCWVVLAVGAYISCSLIWGLLELPYLHGAGAAQGDFGLYLAARFFGLPVTAVSLIVVGASIIVHRRGGTNWTVYGYRTFVVLGIVNVLAAPAVMGWLTWR
jgi:hypothetical protein